MELFMLSLSPPFLWLLRSGLYAGIPVVGLKWMLNFRIVVGSFVDPSPMSRTGRRRGRNPRSASGDDEKSMTSIRQTGIVPAFDCGEG